MIGKLARVRVLMRKNSEIIWGFRMVREERKERVLIRKLGGGGGGEGVGGICINRAKSHLSIGTEPLLHLPFNLSTSIEP